MGRRRAGGRNRHFRGPMLPPLPPCCVVEMQTKVGTQNAGHNNANRLDQMSMIDTWNRIQVRFGPFVRPEVGLCSIRTRKS
ncbi:hypothetical protein BDA96_04G196700 [Sorghum bicolor]|uniref:Uncharacterized protein n=1 Tax=Sorghum bicolor TaxID=4558 RepID=A0A921R3S5_SORBI|nr:hypothetical protein BDA96_04G196700 [Sorghum bicolor]